MVKTSRRISNEKDRYGGYIPRADSNGRRVEVDLDVDPDVDLSFSQRAETPVKTERKVEAPERAGEFTSEKRLYSTTATPTYGKTSEFVGNVVYTPTRKRQSVKRESEAIMPSIKTQAYMTDKPVPELEEKIVRNEKKQSMSAKSKMVLAVYVAVVVMVAVIVIATGLVLSSSTAAVTDLESQIAARNQLIAEQRAEISNLENEMTLTGMATEMGMKKVDVAMEITLLPEVEAVTYEARTNWFDKLCDWLSKII